MWMMCDWYPEWDWIFSLAVESTSRDSISFNSNFIFNSWTLSTFEATISNENLCLSLFSYLHSTDSPRLNHKSCEVNSIPVTGNTSWELVLFINTFI